MVAGLGSAVAAGCVWASSKLTWVRVESADGLGVDRSDAIDGSSWAAASLPLALVLVAAIAAMFAVRGWALRVVAVVVGAVGVAAAVPAVLLLTRGATADEAARLAELPGRASVTSVEAAVLPPLLTVAGGIVALAAATVLLVRPGGAGGLSGKYATPAARRSTAADVIAQDDDVSQRLMWDALDAGIDPTAESEGGGGTPR